jgi:hypothetical protein
VVGVTKNVQDKSQSVSQMLLRGSVDVRWQWLLKLSPAKKFVV